MKRPLRILLLMLILAFTVAPKMQAHDSFAPGKGEFLLNGKPFVIKAAELHYPRIPEPYWENRIELCKALGMNTICLYVFWNVHESQPDSLDFSGQNDLRKFVELCDKHGMKVILRPGPYVCAEWEMGGLPWWLLQQKDIRLREDDPYFLERVGKFEKAVAQQVGDLTIANGGPIIMVQVENEYGSYGVNKPYISEIRDMLKELYPGVTLFQCDWASNFTDNGLDDLVWTMNFGTGTDIDSQFEKLKELRPEAPLMCSEFWSGWFDKWGAAHETRPAEAMIKGIDEMLSKDISFSLYMTHGGTNWGHWAGANSPGYAPDVTSYDYDAPISESGQTTPKYHLLRETIARYTQEQLPAVPKTIKPISIPTFRLTQVAPLFENLPTPHRDTELKTMEEYGQGFGSIIYSTSLPKLAEPSLLRLTDVHDYARIFLNGEYLGKLDRRLGEKEIKLPAIPEGGKLDILVEAMGRINFGRAIKDYKGITEKAEIIVEIGGKEFAHRLKGWDVYNIPDSPEYYDSLRFSELGDTLTAGAYRGYFNLKSPSDTFLDFSSWGKGLVYVNGHPLGRFWNIGPQQTLYMPGCWLKKGRNEILVFDIVGPEAPTVRCLKEPLIDNLRVTDDKPAISGNDSIDLTGIEPALIGSFSPGNGWQKIELKKAAKGRYFCIEADDTHDGTETAAIAEIYLSGADGKRISREPWRVKYASSENIGNGNHSAEKAFDLQESTYWSSLPGVKSPHRLIIDLGAETEISGFEILPRVASGAPSAIKNFKIYIIE